MNAVQYSAAVETLLRAAMDHTKWPGVMAAVAQQLGAEAWALLGYGADKKLVVLQASRDGEGFARELEASLREAAPACSFLASGSPPLVRIDRHADGSALHGAARFARWLDAHGLRYMSGGVLSDEWCGDAFALFFNTDAPASASRDARAEFGAIRPHLEIALRVARRNYEAQVYKETGWALMNAAPHGIVLFDGSLSVIELNREARRIVAERDGIELKGERLQASHAADHARLAAILQRGRDAAGECGQQLWQDTVIFSRPSGRMPIIGTVLSARNARPAVACRAPALLMFLRDMMNEQEPSVTAFARAFHLTPAETRLVETFAQGRTMADHASTEGISDETARWHLKNVLSKTNCRGQVQLLQLIRRALMPHIEAPAV